MISVYNNTTKYKTLTPNQLLDDCKHMILPYVHNNIVTIDIRDNHVEIFGEASSIAKINTNKNLKCSGVIRWFDEGDGFGYIRLENTQSIHFYSCNVIGANQQYPEMVTNVQFEDGEKVEFEITADTYTFKALGAINIKKAA